MQAHFQKVVDELAAGATGSANRIARLHLMHEPPSIDKGEVTDKGSINQRAVLKHRDALVDALHAGTLPFTIQPRAWRRAESVSHHHQETEMTTRREFVKVSSALAALGAAGVPLVARAQNLELAKILCGFPPGAPATRSRGASPTSCAATTPPTWWSRTSRAPAARSR